MGVERDGLRNDQYYYRALEISENRHLPYITKNIGIYGDNFNFQ